MTQYTDNELLRMIAAKLGALPILHEESHPTKEQLVASLAEHE